MRDWSLLDLGLFGTVTAALRCFAPILLLATGVMSVATPTAAVVYTGFPFSSASLL